MTTTIHKTNDDNDNNNNNEYYDVVIVGGGLSGLVVAYEIHKQNEKQKIKKQVVNWKLYEASDVFGGRLKNDNDVNLIDMGGTWIWPKYQPNISKLINELNSGTTSYPIETFIQPDDINSTRVVGGTVQIINRLIEILPKNNLQLNTSIISCNRCENDNKNNNLVCLETKEATTTTSNKTTTSSSNNNNGKIYAKRVIFTIPPKLLYETIQFYPSLSNKKQIVQKNSNTWMADVTKVSLVYTTNGPFWKDSNQLPTNMGLPRNNSNKKNSNNTPAFQVYDGSTYDYKTSVLTFFTKVVPTKTNNNNNYDNDDKELANKCSNQLYNIWKDKRVLSYDKYYVQRWNNEKYINGDSISDDNDDDNDNNDLKNVVNPHPIPIPDLSTNEWNNMLLFAGTETSLVDPGVIEGAVDSAYCVVHKKNFFSVVV